MHTVSADKIIIATGSEAIMPSFIPQHDNIVDSRAFLTRTELPKHLLVLGGGYIGCEMACLAAALGSKVTIVELLDDILLLLDRDVRSEIKRSMKKDLGITILTGNPLQDIVVSPSGDIHAAVCEQKLTADMLLVAAGRRPVTDGLNLFAAGITPASSGCIPVDEFGQTAVPGIYAIGDVNGIMQLAHAATSQGLTAADHACGAETPPFNNIIPGVIFTMPEAAIVGKSQQDFASRKEFPFCEIFLSCTRQSTGRRHLLRFCKMDYSHRQHTADWRSGRWRTGNRTHRGSNVSHLHGLHGRTDRAHHSRSSFTL